MQPYIAQQDYKFWKMLDSNFLHIFDKFEMRKPLVEIFKNIIKLFTNVNYMNKS